jgi:hypothetical protein
MNTLKDANLNPGLQFALADVCTVALITQATADAGCIIPGFGGGCTCSASATYTVDFPTIKGVSELKVANWTHITAVSNGASQFQLVMEGFVVGNSLSTNAGTVLFSL